MREEATMVRQSPDRNPRQARTRRRGRVPLFALILALLPVALGACGGGGSNSGSQGSNQVTVRIGAPLWIGGAPLVLADQKGFDTENGINLQYKIIEELKDLTSSIGAGRLDGGYGVGPGQALTMLSAGIDTTFVLTGDVSLGGDQIIGQKGTSAVADLKGEKVGVETASTGYPMLVYALQSNGMSLDDIKQVELSGAAAPAALNTGRVEAAYTWQPYIALALKKGLNSVYRAADKYGIISDFLVMRDSFVKDHPEAVTDLMKTWEAGVQYLRSNPQESYKLISQGMDIPEKDVKIGLDPANLQITDLQQSINFFNKDWPTLAPTFVEIVNNSDVPNQVTVDEALKPVDNTYAEEASKS
jgi:NitT/TauT family transport system substrate-binding protein